MIINAAQLEPYGRCRRSAEITDDWLARLTPDDAHDVILVRDSPTLNP
jgi:hypothetical protein